jgi:hypothetical protein
MDEKAGLKKENILKNLLFFKKVLKFLRAMKNYWM